MRSLIAPASPPERHLFGQAIEKMQAGAFNEALALLNQLARATPDHPSIHFLRGAVYAEFGRYEEAATDIRTALRLDPKLWAAHFELGLLSYLRSDYTDAASAWSSLNELAESSCYRSFATALLLHAAGRRDEARRHLEQGILDNTENTVLSDNMRNLFRQLDAANATDDKAAATDAKHVLLNSYDEIAGKK